VLGTITYQTSPRGETRVSLRCVQGADVGNPGETEVSLDALLSIVTNPKKAKFRHDDLWQERPGFGHACRPTSFTRHAKRMVADAASLLEETYGKDVLFATFTLTGQTPESKAALAQWSGYVVERLKQFLRDVAPDAESVGVWEWQKNGALHLHWVIGCRDTIQRTTLEYRLIPQWIHLEEVVSQKAGVDLFVNAEGHNMRLYPKLWKNEVVRVVKSVKRYLSKYTSKAKHECDPFFCTRCIKPRYYPSRWWFCDNKLRRDVMARRMETTTAPMSREALHEVLSGILGECVAGSTVAYTFANPLVPVDVTYVFFHEDAAAQMAVTDKVLGLLSVARMRMATTEKPEGGPRTPGSLCGATSREGVTRSRYLTSRWSKYDWAMVG